MFAPVYLQNAHTFFSERPPARCARQAAVSAIYLTVYVLYLDAVVQLYHSTRGCTVDGHTGYQTRRAPDADVVERDRKGPWYRKVSALE